MRSARLTVLMEPGEKAAIAARAAKLGVSSGEFIRLATQSFDESELEVVLQTLSDELEAAIPRMKASFDSIETSIAEVRNDLKKTREHFEGAKD